MAFAVNPRSTVVAGVEFRGDPRESANKGRRFLMLVGNFSDSATSSAASAASRISLRKTPKALTFWIPGTMLAFGICLLTAVSMVQGATGGDPMATVRSTVNQVLNVLNDRQSPQQVRSRRLIEVVVGHFDFADMARSTMGYHWSSLTPDQRKRFVELFTAFMEDAYLNKIEDYSGQKIEFVGETADGSGESEVHTRVLQPNGQPPILVDYRLKQDAGEWKVYDVAVDSISITANYRNQFNRVINNQGFDTLMTEMQNKQQELIASLGR
jgi:phospholipid transport system substrate-binding protein